MADGDYLGAYQRFFVDFIAKVNPDDQLPVRMASHGVTDNEMTGQIIHITLEYLNQKYCPPSLQSFIVQLVIKEIKTICRQQPERCGLKPEDNTYEPLKLMQAITGKVNEICRRYLENSRLALLPPPPSTPLPLTTTHAIKNIRRKMEDRHVIIHDLNIIFNIKDDSSANYYAVFDGHAGQEAAIYCATHLHQYLAESVYYPTDIERALRDAFVTTDAYFIKKSKKYSLNSGTTAVCALILNKKLYVAWVGDSQAALSKRGHVIQIVNPHRPDRNDERDRIEKMGGTVIHFGMWRVNGDLAISRAIGDGQYKPYVTSEPDIYSETLDGTEDFLIIACDGLWDTVDEDTAAKIVYEQVRKDPYNLEDVGRRLVDYSKHQGSSDNISVIVVFLTPPIQIAARPIDSNPLFTDVHLRNMDPDNRYLSSVNGQFDLGFVKQNQTNGSGFETELSPFSRGISANGKHENGTVEYDDDDDLGPETNVDALDDSSDASNLANISRELFPEKDSGEDDQEEDVNLGADSTPAHMKTHKNDLIAESEDSDDEWDYYKADPNKEKENKNLEVDNLEDNTSNSTDKLHSELAGSLDNCESTDKLHLELAGTLDNCESKEEKREFEKEIDSCSDSERDNDKENYPKLIETEVSEKDLEEHDITSDKDTTSDKEEDIMDFQLNPDAKEFVPVSPVIPSRVRNIDIPLSGSPLKPSQIMDDINLPTENEFHEGASHCPHELENEEIISTNGNCTNNKENLELNEKNKIVFNLDMSEMSSTKAEFGDESNASFVTADFHKTDNLDGSFVESSGFDIDPMTASFGPGCFNPLSDPVDLNAVHDLSDTDLDPVIFAQQDCELNHEQSEELGKEKEDAKEIEGKEQEPEKDKDECESEYQNQLMDELNSSDDNPELAQLISPESDNPKHSIPFPDQTDNVQFRTSSPSPNNSHEQDSHEKLLDLTSQFTNMNLSEHIEKHVSEEISEKNMSNSELLNMEEKLEAPIFEPQYTDNNEVMLSELESVEKEPEIPVVEIEKNTETEEICSLTESNIQKEEFNLLEDEFIDKPQTNEPQTIEEVESVPTEIEKAHSPAPDNTNVFQNPLDFNNQLRPEITLNAASEIYDDNDDDFDDKDKIESELALEKDDDDVPVDPEFDVPTGDPFARSISPAPIECSEKQKQLLEEQMEQIELLEKSEHIELSEKSEHVELSEKSEHIELSEKSEQIELSEKSEQLDLVNEQLAEITPTNNPEQSNIKLSESLQEFTGLEQELVPISNGDVIKEEIIHEFTTDKPLEAASEIISETTPQFSLNKILETSKTELESDIIEEKIEQAKPEALEAEVENKVVEKKSVKAVETTAKAKTNKAAPKTAPVSSKSSGKTTPTSPTKTSTTNGTSTRLSVTKKPAAASTVSKTKKVSEVTSKASTPTKLTASKPPAAKLSPRVSLKPKSSPAKPTSTLAEKKLPTNGEAKTAVAAPKPKPTTTSVASKPLVKSSVASNRPTSAVAAKAKPAPTATSTVTKTAMKTNPKSTVTSANSATSRPKTAPSALSITKNRVNALKSPVTDKQVKETANKQISSNRVSTTTTTRTSRSSITQSSATTVTTTATRRVTGSITKKTGDVLPVNGKSSSRITAKTATAVAKTAVKTTVNSKVNGVSDIKVTQKSTDETTKNEQDLPTKNVSPVESSTDNQLLISTD